MPSCDFEAGFTVSRQEAGTGLLCDRRRGSLWGWRDLSYLQGKRRSPGVGRMQCVRMEASSEIRWGVGCLSRRVVWKLLWSSDGVQIFEGGGTAEVFSVILVRFRVSEAGGRVQGFLEGWGQVWVSVFRGGKGCARSLGLQALCSHLTPLQNVPPDLAICCFVLEQSLSVRALQEMLANTVEAGVEVRLPLSRWVARMGGRTFIYHLLFFLFLTHPHRPSIWISG